MEIRSLELENVKSYEHATIAFGPGTNAICGPNGAGKSTILEAIGFALFDVAPCRPIANWVREGQRSARVTVAILAGDEREYEVVRWCGARNQYYVYDRELAGRVVAGSDDVVDWLKKEFGVEETAELAALFRDAVGVPQGLLTAAFRETPEKRRLVFNPLLRVEEYARAATELTATRRTLDEQAQAAEVQIAGYRARVDELPELQEKAAGLARDVKAGAARLAELEGELDRLAGEKQALEAARERVQKLAQEANRLDERIAGLEVQAAQATQAVARAQEAEAVLAASRPGHTAYLAAQARLRELEERARARSAAQRAAGDCRAERQVRADRVARLGVERQAAQTAAAEAERLAPKAQEQERLERALAQVDAQMHAAEAARARLQEEQRRLAQLDERLRLMAAGLAARAALEAEQKEQEHALEALNEALQAVHADEAREAAQVEHLHAQGEALTTLATAQCPVCESELGEERRQTLLERNRAQLAVHEGILAGLRGQAADLGQRGQAALRSLKELPKRLARLPRPAERDALQADLERQQGLVRAAEQEAGRLQAASAQAGALRGELARLGDPRAAYQSALALAGRGADLDAELASARTGLAQVESRLTQLEQELAAFDRVDAELDTARAELQAQEPDHRRYLQHEREAGELPGRQAHLAKLAADLASDRANRQALADELQAAREAFQPQVYERTLAAYVAASEARSALASRTQLQRTQLEEAEGRIAELQQIAARLAVAEGELAAWRELGRVLDHLRRVLKEAGPQVTRALVQIISLQAARLYADIVGEQTGRLRWSEDYEIMLDYKGHQRSFEQLSGGEQMAAALAVRLALLREVSAIDIAFFDEPTANLDDTRRENLAEQILAVKGFAQLFVVSHDDTFERATDQVVRLTKEDGASQVMV